VRDGQLSEGVTANVTQAVARGEGRLCGLEVCATAAEVAVGSFGLGAPSLDAVAVAVPTACRQPDGTEPADELVGISRGDRASSPASGSRPVRSPVSRPVPSECHRDRYGLESPGQVQFLSLLKKDLRAPYWEGRSRNVN
jgi:hypothetical protein